MSQLVNPLAKSPCLSLIIGGVVLVGRSRSATDTKQN